MKLTIRYHRYVYIIVIAFILFIFVNETSFASNINPQNPEPTPIPIQPTNLDEQSLVTAYVTESSGLNVLPPQGCTPFAPFYDVCASYVGSGGDDAGTEMNCYYTNSWNEIYFGTCQTNNASIVSGIRFPNVAIEPDKDILSSYIEFTVDGPPYT